MLCSAIISIMNESVDNAPVVDKEHALAEIGHIITQVGIMGFNDHEIPALLRLRDEVSDGGLDPGKGLAEVRSILSNKQDYH